MLRVPWTWIVIVGATILFGSMAVVACLIRPGSDAMFRLMRVWARSILRAGDVRVVVEDENRPARPSPAVYVCNHRSNLDVWAVVQALPDSTRFVAKKSLFRIPFLGWAMSAGGFVAVDRSDRTRAIETLNEASRRIASGISLVMFAEGTRSRSGRLASFKKGPFHVALAAGCPIVPVAIAGSYELLPPESMRMRPGQVDIRLAPAIATAGRTAAQLPELMHEVREAMLARLPEAARPAAASA